MAEAFNWIKPSLLWQPDAQDMLRSDFFRPALLEFRSDDFVKDFLALASSKRPSGLQQAIAQPLQPGRRLKFFQPAHGNFYLTCASLCCRLPGFPDREVQKGNGENTFFVLRKKVAGTEFGWVAGETNNGWRAINGQPMLDQEERLPLFPATTGQSRNIFFGYVPVSSQQTYSAAPADSPVQTEDPRLDELSAIFIEPLGDRNLLFGTGIITANTTLELRTSVYLLLDLFEYFGKYLPNVATALSSGSANLNVAESDLLTSLRAQPLGGTLKLATALGVVASKVSALNEPGDIDPNALGFNADYNLKSNALNLVTLKTKVSTALQSRPETKPALVKVPKLGQKAGDIYVLRYVYERPQCDPPSLYVSQPTDPFELAPFFDPEAPGRPIRIALPVDVSIGGLRKFPKNVAFMMSLELRKKLSTINKGMLKGDPPGSEGSFDLGHICSFSIPIITLIAFILLMIIAILLNIIFWWLPLLKICFPLNLKAKA
jgi:hypothetical protein